MCHLRRSDLSHPNNLARVHHRTLYLQPIAPLTMETQLAKILLFLLSLTQRGANQSDNSISKRKAQDSFYISATWILLAPGNSAIQV